MSCWKHVKKHGETLNKFHLLLGGSCICLCTQVLLLLDFLTTESMTPFWSLEQNLRIFTSSFVPASRFVTWTLWIRKKTGKFLSLLPNAHGRWILLVGTTRRYVEMRVVDPPKDALFCGKSRLKHIQMPEALNMQCHPKMVTETYSSTWWLIITRMFSKNNEHSNKSRVIVGIVGRKSLHIVVLSADCFLTMFRTPIIQVWGL